MIGVSERLVRQGLEKGSGRQRKTRGLGWIAIFFPLNVSAVERAECELPDELLNLRKRGLLTDAVALR